jgi:hypothetical protein
VGKQRICIQSRSDQRKLSVVTSLRGRAWISQTTDLDQLPSDFVGYWETDDDDPRVLEDGLRWSSLEEALAWARERAPVIMIRLATTDYFSAGRDQPRWRPDAPRWPVDGGGGSRSRGACDPSSGPQCASPV